MDLLFFYLLYNLNVIHYYYWVHPINVERPQKGELYTHYADLCHFKDRFLEFCRMSPMQIDHILKKIHPLIMKKHTKFREPVSPEDKLIITIT